MVIAVEPMVNAGRPEVRMRDEWVAETADGSPSAHFEHTVAITANGPWISDAAKGSNRPVVVKNFRLDSTGDYGEAV